MHTLRKYRYHHSNQAPYPIFTKKVQSKKFNFTSWNLKSAGWSNGWGIFGFDDNMFFDFEKVISIWIGSLFESK